MKTEPQPPYHRTTPMLYALPLCILALAATIAGRLARGAVAHYLLIPIRDRID